jgi:hypothetical protein
MAQANRNGLAKGKPSGVMSIIIAIVGITAVPVVHIDELASYPV